MKHTKIWGTTTEIFSGPGFELHRIEVIKGGYCSKHSHKSKYNLFYVESGKLRIRIYKNELEDVTELSPGEQTTVAPIESHRFEAVEDTIAYEFYWVILDPNDITRLDQGGVVRK